MKNFKKRFIYSIISAVAFAAVTMSGSVCAMAVPSLVDQYVANRVNFNNRGCTLRDSGGRNNVSILRVPCTNQIGLRCGNHSFVNTGYFARLNNLGELIMSLSSDRAGVLVNRTINDVRNIREVDGDNNNGDDLSDGELATLNGGNFSAIAPFSENVYRSILAPGRNRDINEENYFRGSFRGGTRYNGRRYNNALDMMVARFADTNRPEVFIVNTGDHWIAVRVERRENGQIGVVFANSFGGDGIPNRIRRLARLFSYHFA